MGRMATTEIIPTTTYEIRVYCMTTWPTGTPRGTAVRTFQIEEEESILGGMRAIDAAIEKCNGKAMSDYSPEISPNPGELGYPLGTQR